MRASLASKRPFIDLSSPTSSILFDYKKAVIDSICLFSLVFYYLSYSTSDNSSFACFLDSTILNYGLNYIKTICFFLLFKAF